MRAPRVARLAAMLMLAMALLPVTAGAAQGEPQASDERGAEVGGDDIVRMIETLEDPDARAELIDELKLLLQARASAAPEQPAEPAGLIDRLQDLAQLAWDSVTSIDAAQLALSLSMTLAIVLATLVARWLLLRALRRLYERLRRNAGSDAGPEQAHRDLGVLPATVTRLIDIVLAVLAVALIAESWGAGLSGLLQTDLGSRIAEALLAIVIILIVTALLLNVSGSIVRRLLTLSTRNSGRSERRLDTLQPLLNSVLRITVGALSTLLVLSELGVNIGPLLAGAGILGLAIGFGAQTLVKDLIGGVIILLEDSASVGDVVDLGGGHVGVVEELRIRFIQLRDVSGSVHHIPYGDITSIVNLTKDFSYYLLDVGVAYRENTDEVCAVLKEIDEGLRADETFGPDIQAPLEILGVNRFAASAVEIRARIRTNPGRQWAVGREFNRRMKQVFDERGIEIPFPHTTVYFGEPKSGAAPPARLTIDGDAPAT